jgi:hypothetical protein
MLFLYNLIRFLTLWRNFTLEWLSEYVIPSFVVNLDSRYSAFLQ